MEEEFEEFDRKNSWNSVYQEIRNASTSFDYTFKDARKTENKNLNRYRDVNPFDHSRVRLERGDKDYINASLVKVPSTNRSYILTQGPLASTMGHFWLMVWEQGSTAILMLNRVIEKNAVKCHQYWPVGAANGGDDELLLSDVGILVSYIGEKEASNYTLRKFHLVDFQTGKNRTVLQFHYTTWPDFGVPESPAAFLNFLFTVREAGVLEESVGPAIVHCSAGIGRSGTFCLVDSCLVLIEKKGDAKSVNIRELLLEMRRYRMGLIQTPDQLRFSYLAIIEGSKGILNKIDNNSVPLVSKTEEMMAFIKGEDDCEKRDIHNDTVDLISDSGESSDEGIADSTCTSGVSSSPPPPLPPRPVRNHSDSPTSCNSISDSSVMPDNSSEISPENSAPPPLTSNDMKNELSSNPGSDIANHCKETESEEKNRINTHLQNSVSSDLDSLRSEANSPDQESAAEIRKRKRKERSEKTAAIVQKIKKKQLESELWQKRRNQKERRGSYSKHGK